MGIGIKLQLSPFFINKNNFEKSTESNMAEDNKFPIDSELMF